ncbi:hypothetical protein [Glaciibacter psychrotolerans]|uniref:Uncharacterized protein n=1 Tax=Glaciibacter psychrotolerans TaxID=670054 RepID=A0A7Z0J4W4_9MICO|nr:hypothetical protein [Leifsonia psychrotolerans]NYJ18501.1 hypothetical protein [Leifsonia psychrotolerans]
MADLESAIRIARTEFAKFSRSIAVVVQRDLGIVGMGLLALVTRAQGFHDGALHALEANNPYATFPLIRCYAENAAALVWVLDHPGDIGRLSALAAQDERFAIGRLVANAAKRAPGFKDVYEQLSEFTHPVASGFTQPFRATSDESSFRWSSVPSFGADEDKITACFWLVELTEMHADVWPRAYRATMNEEAVAGLSTPVREVGKNDIERD